MFVIYDNSNNQSIRGHLFKIETSHEYHPVRLQGSTVISRICLQNYFCKSLHVFRFDFILITDSTLGPLHAGLKVAPALLT